MTKRFTPGNRYKGRYNNSAKFVRKNAQIRAYEVRVIGPDAKQIGVMSKNEAIQLAKSHQMDLVEISPSARPPVCRILDFGKYMYEQSKKGKDKPAPTSKLKEVKFRVRIEQHDYMFKLKHAEEFLDKGNKVKLSLMFRGRENEHIELGFDVINRAIEGLSHIATKDIEPRKVGRNIIVTMTPLPAAKRKLIYNVKTDEEESESSES